MISSFVRALVSAFKARRELALENVALRQQLAVLRRSVKRSRLSNVDREFWVLLRVVPSIYSFASSWVSEVSPAARNTLDFARIPRASKLLICGLFQKGRVLAQDGVAARKAYGELVAKWTPLAPAVVRSLEEAGNQLLTFYEFPRAMWKSIRTTNALENLNREFRRRTKTQASFSSEESAVALLFGLIASGQIQLRRIDGYQRLSEVLEHAEVAA